MKNTILIILVLSLFVALGCENKTETTEDRKAFKDKAIVQTQDAAEKSKAQDIQVEEATHEVTITIKEGQFEPAAFELKKNVKVIFKVKSLDVEHTFTVAALGIKESINPGEEIIVETVPDTGAPFIHFICDIHGAFLENGTMTMR